MGLFMPDRVSTRLAIAVVVAGLAVMGLTSSALGQSHGATRAGARGPAVTKMSPGFMKSARGITLRNGEKVFGVRVVVKLSGGKMVARPASFGSCQYCSLRQNLGSGMCMSSYPNQQGHEVDQFACNGGAANQQWIYATYTDGEPYLFAYNANHLCLNNYGFSFSNGNKMALWSCNSASTAMWFGAGGSNWNGWLLVHLFSSFGTWSHQCVTTLPGRSSGAPIEEWTCDKTSSWQAFSGLWDALSPPGAADRSS